MSDAPRHYLSVLDLQAEEIQHLFERTRELKQLQRTRTPHETMPGRVLGMIFEKSSTRTRVSFEAGIAQMGGYAIFLSPRDTQLGRGEPVEDTARVLSRMVDLLAIRSFEHATIERFAAYSRIPVINALTDRFHPCQVLADIFTFEEQRGSIRGRTVAYVGDGNNMCNSFVNAASLLGFHLHVACPAGYLPESEGVARAGELVRVGQDPVEAVRGADLVVTDVWASMGQEEEAAERRNAFEGYQVDAGLMSHADADALVMHCLPAYRGLEISEDVLEGRQSVVWDEAENRLHVQKALMEFLVHG